MGRAIYWARLGASIAWSLLLLGCASTQLNYNTLDLASTVGDIQTKQVLFNLSLLLDNPGAIPTHVDLTSGTATTTNSIAPTFGSPLNTGLSTVDTIAKLAAAAPTTTTTTQITSSTASNTVTTQLQDQWVQNWAYDPVVAGDALRRLRSLYRYGLGQISDQQLVDEYPLVEKPQTIMYAGGVKTSSGNYQIFNDPIYCPDIGIGTTSDDVQDITRNKKNTAVRAAECSSVQLSIQIPDEQYMHEPGCIICIGKHEVYTRTSRPWINERLRRLHGGWLFTEANELPPDAQHIGNYAKHSLYIRKGDLEKLSDLTLFVLTTTAQSAAATAAANPGGAAGKPKATAPLVATGLNSLVAP